MKDITLKPVIESLESLFSKFNQQFYDNELQKPIITVSPDTTKGAYGWCTSWKAWGRAEAQEDDEGYYEINICAEYLSRPFKDIAETLLHEMVHLYNLQEGIQDTSRAGTYHNTKFRDAAATHGLTVEKDPKYGWTKTTLNQEAKDFIETIQDRKFQLFRKPMGKGSGKAKAKQSTRKYVCPGCGCIIRATKEVHVICADCDLPFEAEEASED